MKRTPAEIISGRAWALTVTCPQCLAGPDQQCTGVRGYIRTSPHLRRYYVAGEQP